MSDIKEFPDKILLIKDNIIEDYWVLKNLTQCEDAEYIRKDIVDEMLNHAYLAGQEAMREQFEKNRLAACDNMTEEEAEREQEFTTDFIEKNLHVPTYSDAIEHGRKQMINKAVEWLKYYIPYDDFGGNMEWLVPFENDECMIQHFKTYMEE